MAISDWPADERPREKLRARGAIALSDTELLAIFLRTGVTGKTAVDLARELLIDFGDLRTLLQASQDSFCSARGLGTAKFTQLQAVLEMARRHFQNHCKVVTPSPALTTHDSFSSHICANINTKYLPACFWITAIA